MKVLKHDGSRHHGVGIQPTVPVARTLQGVAAGRDELLEKAIAVVGGEASAAGPEPGEDEKEPGHRKSGALPEHER